MKSYIVGEKVNMCDSVYLVEKVYSLTDEEMKKHNLYHRNRVTLKKLEGVNGLEKLDFAIGTN